MTDRDECKLWYTLLNKYEIAMKGGVIMPRVIHFEINADNPKRAVDFYSKVFGWKIHSWQGPMEYWLIETGEPDQPGIDGAITKRQHPQLTTINTISVPSIDEYMQKVVNHGGMIATPKSNIPGIGQFCYCHDSEGNTFGILQPECA